MADQPVMRVRAYPSRFLRPLMWGLRALRFIGIRLNEDQVRPLVAWIAARSTVEIIENQDNSEQVLDDSV